MNLVRTADWSDVEFLAERLRQHDIEEVGALGFSPLDALSHGFDNSAVCYTGLEPDTGLPLCMMGVVQSPYPNLGLIWLLGTPAIQKHGWRFLSMSRPMLAEMFETTGFEGFYNYTYAKNHEHHKWLRWLGFTFIRKVKAGGSPFYEFIKLKG
jgi:hypothetical protein